MGVVFCAGFLGCFFSPSLVGESSLSLLLLRFIDISIGSIVVNDCSVAVVDADDDCFVLMVDVEVVAVEILVTVVGSVDEFTLFSVVDGFFMGVFFPFFFLVTWVHPSSSFLLKLSLWFSLVSIGAIIVMTGEGVVTLVVVVVVVVVVFIF